MNSTTAWPSLWFPSFSLPPPQLYAGCDDALRSLVPAPREIRCAGEDRVKPASARPVFCEGVPSAAAPRP